MILIEEHLKELNGPTGLRTNEPRKESLWFSAFWLFESEEGVISMKRSCKYEEKLVSMTVHTFQLSLR